MWMCNSLLKAREYCRYGQVRRIGILLGLDFPDDQVVRVLRNKAGAVIEIIPVKL